MAAGDDQWRLTYVFKLEVANGVVFVTLHYLAVVYVLGFKFDLRSIWVSSRSGFLRVSEGKGTYGSEHQDKLFHFVFDCFIKEFDCVMI